MPGIALWMSEDNAEDSNKGLPQVMPGIALWMPEDNAEDSNKGFPQVKNSKNKIKNTNKIMEVSENVGT